MHYATMSRLFLSECCHFGPDGGAGVETLPLPQSLSTLLQSSVEAYAVGVVPLFTRFRQHRSFFTASLRVRYWSHRPRFSLSRDPFPY